MNQNFDFGNLTNKQKRNLIRQVETRKAEWITAVYKALVDKGEIPRYVWNAASSGTLEGQQIARDWLERNGYEVIDIWAATDTGAVLKRHGSIISELKVEIERKAMLPSQGNN